MSKYCLPGRGGEHEFYTDRSIGGDGQTRCRQCGYDPVCDFECCPLAYERGTEELCEGIDAVIGARAVATGPSTEVSLQACVACARAYDNWEPSDEQMANRAGVEGGIGYRFEDTTAYRDALKDAGRLK